MGEMERGAMPGAYTKIVFKKQEAPDTNHHNGHKHPSIMAAFEQVKTQVGYQYFADLRTRRVDPLYNEMCLIISEVLLMDHDAAIKINGIPIFACLVQEVFGKLRCDHLRHVFDKFQEYSCSVHNKKAYLRTALYNVFFEYNIPYYFQGETDGHRRT
jgi:hypothetical protein